MGERGEETGDETDGEDSQDEGGSPETGTGGNKDDKPEPTPVLDAFGVLRRKDSSDSDVSMSDLPSPRRIAVSTFRSTARLPFRTPRTRTRTRLVLHSSPNISAILRPRSVLRPLSCQRNRAIPRTPSTLRPLHLLLFPAALRNPSTLKTRSPQSPLRSLTLIRSPSLLQPPSLPHPLRVPDFNLPDELANNPDFDERLSLIGLDIIYD
ncbi:hypothetical protein QC761_609796 [Podospora bellae-mahoneyi]|uniref:Uncharacterized protein n=1 Tax=Podospora bellae-mahoneyi TaxID=2093777 RepID=A0ABR0FDP9_9PEZI|nr:hypothetical protein QC761_609796 [Podospora bellae-mahoneyi]